jgi:hypothetical protein
MRVGRIIVIRNIGRVRRKDTTKRIYAVCVWEGGGEGVKKDPSVVGIYIHL